LGLASGKSDDDCVLRADRTFFVLCLVAGVVAITAAAIRWSGFPAAQDVPYLSQNAPAKWIQASEPYDLNARRQGRILRGFRRGFTTRSEVTSATLFLETFRFATVELDGRESYRSGEDLEQWRGVQRVDLPGPIAPGPHELVIVVTNIDGPPAVKASCDRLGLTTDTSWEASVTGESWAPVRIVGETQAPDIAGEFPSTARALGNIAPLLLTLLLGFGALAWVDGRRTEVHAAPLLTASFVRWVLIGAWAVLGVNNAVKIPIHVGYDVFDHYLYVKFIVDNLSLPLASDGWQMFQSPLNYILNAQVYAVSSAFLDEESVFKVLRIIPLFCGIGQIEIAYRCGRLVFAKSNDLQVITTLVSGLLPMSLYMSQALGNEPLAGLMSGITILLMLKLLLSEQPEQPVRLYILIGVFWGLALLSKVTPILLAGPMVLVLIHRWARRETATGVFLGRVSMMLGSTSLVCGWYYVRNLIHFGRPFVGGWEQAPRMAWWQDPGYRTGSHLFSFGESLTQPVFSGIQGIWDSLYSTVWLDGFISGLNSYDYRPPWNESAMVAGAALALVPMLLLLLSGITTWTSSLRHVRTALLLCWISLGLYLLAVIDLYLQVPVYSTAKGSYLLGLIPCLGLLVAGGAAPLIRLGFGRIVILPLLMTGGTVAYLAYFVWSVPVVP
jgi:hypothetical protein